MGRLKKQKTLKTNFQMHQEEIDPKHPRIREGAMFAGASVCHPGGDPLKISESAFQAPLASALQESTSGVQPESTRLPPLVPIPPLISSEYLKTVIAYLGSEKKTRALFTKACAQLCHRCVNFPVPRFVQRLFPELKGSQFPNWSFPEDERQQWRKRIINHVYKDLIKAGIQYNEPLENIGGLVAETVTSLEWQPPTFTSPYTSHIPRSLCLNLKKQAKPSQGMFTPDEIDQLLKNFAFVQFSDDQEPGTSKDS